jgi:ribosomal protein S4E
MEEKNEMKTKNKIWILVIVLVFLASCKTQENDPIQNALSIANSNQEVNAIMEDEDFSVDVKKVNKGDIDAMPTVFEGLSGELYRVYYKTSEFDLIVITNEKEVLRIVPVTKIKI